MFKDIRRSAFIWFFAALALLAVLRLVWYDLTTRSIQSNEQIALSRETIGELRLVFSDLQDAETGQRGYLLTGDESYLGPYHEGFAAMPRRFDLLQKSLSNDAEQMVNLNKLQLVASSKYHELAATIDTRKTNGMEAAVSMVKTNDEKRLMDQARVLVKMIRDRWYEELEAQVANSRSNRRWGLTSFVVLTLVDLGWLTLGFVLISRYAAQRVIATTREMDARRVAEDANRSKTAFLANMSHELRTPLNAIIGYSEMLAEDAEAAQNQEQLSDLKKILLASRQLLGQINTLLDMSKIESGKMTLHNENFAVEAIVSEVISIARPLIEGNGNKLAITYPDQPETIFGDPQKTRQILLNLLSNAAKFTSDGKIDLKVQHDARHCIFTITDSGIGMSSELISRLFRPFEQGDPRISARFGGTGLGLAISREFARMMGGDIAVASQLGKGSTFTVTLPVRGAA